MKKLYIFALIVLFNGCDNDNINGNRQIKEVLLHSDTKNSKVKIQNVANIDKKEFYDIKNDGKIYLDLLNTYNLQIGAYSGAKKCILFNGFRANENNNLNKKDIYLKCSDNFNYEENPVFGHYYLKINKDLLLGTEIETYITDKFKGVISTVSGSTNVDYLMNKPITNRGFSMLSFETNNIYPFEYLDKKILEISKNISTKIPIKSINIKKGKISETAITNGILPENVLIRKIKLETPLYIGTVSMLNILSRDLLKLFKLKEPSKFISENIWDAKSSKMIIYIILQKQEDYTIPIKVELKVGIESFEDFTDKSTDVGDDTLINY